VGPGTFRDHLFFGFLTLLLGQEKHIFSMHKLPSYFTSIGTQVEDRWFASRSNNVATLKLSTTPPQLLVLTHAAGRMYNSEGLQLMCKPSWDEVTWSQQRNHHEPFEQEYFEVLTRTLHGGNQSHKTWLLAFVTGLHIRHSRRSACLCARNILAEPSDEKHTCKFP
jgi:hypothetical protein